MSDSVLTGVWSSGWTRTAPQSVLSALVLGAAVVCADLTGGWAQLFAMQGAGGKLLRGFTPIMLLMATVSALLVRLVNDVEVLHSHAAAMAIIFLVAGTFVLGVGAPRRILHGRGFYSGAKNSRCSVWTFEGQR